GGGAAGARRRGRRGRLEEGGRSLHALPRRLPGLTTAAVSRADENGPGPWKSRDRGAARGREPPCVVRAWRVVAMGVPGPPCGCPGEWRPAAERVSRWGWVGWGRGGHPGPARCLRVVRQEGAELPGRRRR